MLRCMTTLLILLVKVDNTFHVQQSTFMLFFLLLKKYLKF
jgi:hypothetical protein